MSETFKRLSQDFAPMDEVQGDALSADKGQLKSWVSNLPRANVAGLELISRRCHPVALRVYQNKHAGSLMRGIEADPLNDNLPRQFLMSGRLDHQHQHVEVIYSYEPNRIGLPRYTEKFDSKAESLAFNMDYSLLTAQAT